MGVLDNVDYLKNNRRENRGSKIIKMKVYINSPKLRYILYCSLFFQGINVWSTLPWSLDVYIVHRLIISNVSTVFYSMYTPKCNSVQFSRSVVSDSLPPHELQHARPPCLSQTPRVYPNPCPSSQWCHPAISSSVIPFSSCPQSLPASGLFPMSQLFAWGGQSTGVSASASVLPMNTQDLSPSEWTGIIC